MASICPTIRPGTGCHRHKHKHWNREWHDANFVTGDSRDNKASDLTNFGFWWEITFLYMSVLKNAKKCWMSIFAIFSSFSILVLVLNSFIYIGKWNSVIKLHHLYDWSVRMTLEGQNLNLNGVIYRFATVLGVSAKYFSGIWDCCYQSAYDI